MTKLVYYRNVQYTLQFLWINSVMRIKKEGGFGYITIPTDCLHDIQKLKPYIIMAIENKNDSTAIEHWDGEI